MAKKTKKVSVESLLHRIEKLEARVAELQSVMCAGLKVVVDPEWEG